MVNIAKQMTYWENGSGEDWAVAGELLDRGRTRHALFFAHLAVEKLLKALVCRASNDLAPPIHNLVRLAERAGVELSQDQIDLLAEVNEFNIEGRYPDMLAQPPADPEARDYMIKIGEMLEWLTSQLNP
jgi:HEPN domain-containing protein